MKKYEKSSKIKALSTSGVKQVKLNKYKKASYNILYMMINDYECVKYYEKYLNYLPNKEERYLANEIVYTYKKFGELVLADFITSLNDKEDLLKLMKEILRSVSLESNFDAFKDYVNVIREYNRDLEIKRLRRLISEESNLTIKAEYLEKIRLLKIGE